MTNLPLVSVLMACRNNMPYVKETVSSIICQTLREWEFIIVDNASDDGTREYLAGMEGADGRIKLIRNDASTDQATGLNIGLKQCRCAWVMRIDADDVALPDRLERQLAFIKDNPDISVTATLIYYINEKGAVIGKNTSEFINRAAVKKAFENNKLIGISHPSVAMKRSAAEEAGGYRPQFWPADDVDLWARIMENGHAVLVQPEYLMKYRIHDSSSSFSLKGAIIGRRKAAWVKECMRRRRKGEDESDEEEFLEMRKREGPFKRADRARRDMGKILYKYAAASFANKRYLKMLFFVSAASLLRPEFVAGQLMSKRLWDGKVD